MNTLDNLSCWYLPTFNARTADACLLGSPIGGLQSITKVLSSKKQSLELMGERLKLLHSHDALCLLKNALALPKILYVLRSAPCVSCSILAELDRLQRSLLEAICNVTLSDVAWSQASLPTRAGGLGIRKFTMLATPAFLASAAGSASLAGRILPPTFEDTVCPVRAEALSLWSQVHTEEPPSGCDATKQQAWDAPLVESAVTSLLSSADDASKGRLLVLMRKECLAVCASCIIPRPLDG